MATIEDKVISEIRKTTSTTVDHVRRLLAISKMGGNIGKAALESLQFLSNTLQIEQKNTR